MKWYRTAKKDFAALPRTERVVAGAVADGS